MAEAPVMVRVAAEADGPAIVALIRSAPRMNPTGLRWPNFVVAERGGRLVGAAQLRPSGAGVAELGSLVVEPAERGRGLAGRLIAAALARADGRVLVVTAAGNARHYEPWAFRPVAPWRAPAPVALNWGIGQAATVLRMAQGGRPRRMLVLEARGPFG